MGQGDLLSPFLFVIGMEALSRLIDKAVMRGMLLGHRLKIKDRDEDTVSHLLFADDTQYFFLFLQRFER